MFRLAHIPSHESSNKVGKWRSSDKFFGILGCRSRALGSRTEIIVFITEDEEIGYERQVKQMETRLTSRIIHDRHSKGLVLNRLLIESCFHCREQNSLMRRMKNKERRDRFGKWYLVWLETGGRHNAAISLVWRRLLLPVATVVYISCVT